MCENTAQWVCKRIKVFICFIFGQGAQLKYGVHFTKHASDRTLTQNLFFSAHVYVILVEFPVWCQFLQCPMND